MKKNTTKSSFKKGLYSKDILLQKYRILLLLYRETTTGKSIGHLGNFIIKTLSKTFNWDGGTLWYVDKKTNTLTANSVWTIKNLDKEIINQINNNFADKKKSFLYDVRGAKKSVWIENLESNPKLARKDLTKKAQIKSIAAFALKTNDDINYVIEFYSTRIKKKHKTAIALIDSINSDLCHILDQQRERELFLDIVDYEFKSLLGAPIPY